MFGSGKNREQKKERQQQKKSKESVYNSKHVRLVEKKQKLALARKVQESAKKPVKGKGKGKKGGGSYTYIVNPLTNRRVNIYGVIGKQIINNFVRTLNE